MDFQLSDKNTLTIRYQYSRNTQDNAGIGEFSLPSTGYNSHSTEQTVQISDTQIISPNIVNETRFQYIRDSDNQNPLSFDPTLVVQGAFTGGGSSQGISIGNQDHYELQNYTSIAHGKHFIKFGGRLRGTQYSSTQNSGFNGSYNFASLDAYQITENGIAEGLTPAQIRALGGGASQFSLVAGAPLSDVSMLDVGLYAEDEWRIRPNISLSYGLRYETQTGIPYEGDWAPRVSLAWGLGHSKAPKTVIRAGYGIFYDRFSYDYLLQAERYNGVTQQQYIVANPNFLSADSDACAAGAAVHRSPTMYQVQSNLHVPYTMEAAISVERQVTKNATISLTYLNSRGVHQLFLRNANAPLPGTYNPTDPNSGIRPLGEQHQHLSIQLGRRVRAEPAHRELPRERSGRSFRCSASTRSSYANSDLGSGGPISIGSSGEGFGGAFGGGGGGSAAVRDELLRPDGRLRPGGVRRSQPRLSSAAPVRFRTRFASARSSLPTPARHSTSSSART